MQSHKKSALGQCLTVLLSVQYTATAFAGDDDYLRALEQEVEKIDAESSSAGADPGTPSVATPDATQALFEQYLRASSSSTFQLYQKLPKHIRTEVFQQHGHAADLSALRGDVIKHLLRSD